MNVSLLLFIDSVGTYELYLDNELEAPKVKGAGRHKEYTIKIQLSCKPVRVSNVSNTVPIIIERHRTVIETTRKNGRRRGGKKTFGFD